MPTCVGLAENFPGLSKASLPLSHIFLPTHFRTSPVSSISPIFTTGMVKISETPSSERTQPSQMTIYRVVQKRNPDFNRFTWFNMGRITQNDRCLIKTIKTENSTHKRNMA